MTQIDRYYRILIYFFLFSFSPILSATLFDDIAYSQLKTELVAALPTGSGVPVAIAEAFTGSGCHVVNNPSECLYRPDKSIKDYRDSNSDATPPDGYDHSSGLGFSTGFSGHASGVAGIFYGDPGSTSPGISEVHVFAADHWLYGGYLNTTTSSTPQTSTIRVSNHSYEGNITLTDTSQKAEAIEILGRIDWITDRDEQIVVAASTRAPLIGTAYNVIAVGRTDGGGPPAAVDLGGSVYNNNQRTRPDIVAPESTTSGATPRVASAAAMLAGYAHDQAQGTAANINSKSIYNAERAEVIKAVLMAGASRETINSDGRANISDYRSAGNETANGLDQRYGAGQLNIFNSYHILSAGEQNAGQVNNTGFDYNDSFGGQSGADSIASYLFNIADEMSWFAASLVWNLTFDTGTGQESSVFSDYMATFYNLDLNLYSLVTGTLIASSTSSIDNTENIWLKLAAGDYRLDVIATGSAFDHDYALAWQASPVPLPGTLWLLIGALSGLGLLKSRQ